MTDETNIQEIGGADKAKLYAAVAAVAAGIAGYYLLGGGAAWQRWVAVAAGIVVAALLLAFSRYGSDFRQFMAAARVELRKIVWPTRDDTLKTTAIVFLFTAVTAVFFWLLDLGLAAATRVLTGQGG
jgi:preprotein translocase subunit SecE